MKIFDFVTAVAIAVVGGTATANNTSLVLGLAALVTLLLAHAVLRGHGCSGR